MQWFIERWLLVGVVTVPLVLVAPGQKGPAATVRQLMHENAVLLRANIVLAQRNDELNREVMQRDKEIARLRNRLDTSVVPGYQNYAKRH